MPKYKVFIEVGIHLDVKANDDEGALARAHDALQVSTLKGCDAEITDKYTVKESVEVDGSKTRRRFVHVWK